MADYMTLLGSEQVQNAGHRISGAAELMSRAASQMDETLLRHQRFLEDWLERFEKAVEHYQRPLVVSNGQEPVQRYELARGSKVFREQRRAQRWATTRAMFRWLFRGLLAGALALAAFLAGSYFLTQH